MSSDNETNSVIKIVCGEVSDSQLNYKEICMMSIYPKALQEFTAFFVRISCLKRKNREL